jgi:hypothetical protein
MQYFTSDSRVGRVRYGSIHWRIAVDASPTNHQRIGDASEVGITTTGLALWQLRVHGDEVPGRWILIDGQFVPAEAVKD